MKPSIAILGASADRRKFGNKAVRAYLLAGYEVYPVNPHEKTIEGLRVYRSARELPCDRLDRASVYLRPEVALAVLPDLTHLPIGEVHFNPGADAPEVLARAAELGLNVVTGCSIIAAGLRPDQLD